MGETINAYRILYKIGNVHVA